MKNNDIDHGSLKYQTSSFWELLQKIMRIEYLKFLNYNCHTRTVISNRNKYDFVDLLVMVFTARQLNYLGEVNDLSYLESALFQAYFLNLHIHL